MHFQKTPWDLYAVFIYTAVMSLVLLALNVGNLVAILLVLFVPGYLLVAALFPGTSFQEKPEFDWIERIALSFGLSLAVVPLLVLLLNFTPWGIRLAPIVVTIVLFSAGLGYAAYWRRMRLPSSQRLALTVDFGLLDWQGHSALDKGLTIALAASVAVAGLYLAYVVLTPRPGETFTDFYMLGPAGNASGSPTSLNVSELGSVIIGIANHEAASANYTVRVDLVGVRLVYNATVGANLTVEVNRTTWSWANATVANGANWTYTYTFSIPYAGLWKVQFLLFKDGVFSSAYRRLQFYTTVT